MCRAKVLRAVALLFAALHFIPGAAADRLELRNGDVITGTIESMDETQIRIRTDYGLLEVDRGAVALGEFGSGHVVAADSLIFEFRLNGNLYDTAGDYRLINNGMRFVPDATGLPESALHSDGGGTYLSVAPREELNGLDEFTLTFDVRAASASGTCYLAAKWTTADGEAADGKFALQYSGSALTLYVVGPDGEYSWTSARGAIETGEWTQIATTFAFGKATIYVDGSEAGSRTMSFSTLLDEDAPLLFMTAQARTDDSYGHYNTVGDIDNIRLYRRALSASEIAALSGVQIELEESSR